MSLIQLTFYPRETTGKNANRRTRARGRIPAVVYGARKATACELDAAEFARNIGTRGAAGHILSLTDSAASSTSIALLREIQRHPVRDFVFHVDLFEIPADKPISVQVPLEVYGEALDIKRGDATLMRVRHSVSIRCLPSELPESVKVDISGMKTGQKVHASDLKVEGVELDEEADEVLLVLQSTAAFASAESAAAVVVEGAEEAVEGEVAVADDKDKKDEKKDEKKKDEPKKEEPKKDEPKKDEPKKDEPKK
jgi:large subunit ribosomal protein L25